MAIPEQLDVGRTLLDRLVMDMEGKPLGRVDDIELAVGDDGRITMTALLLGPLALGTRLGGRLGTWWVSVGRRLRAESSPGRVRIPTAAITDLGPGEVRVGLLRPEHEPRLMTWTREKVIGSIPGAGESG